MSAFMAARPPLVVDTSFAIEVLDGNELALDAWASAASAFVPRLVPGHFWLETANALLGRSHLEAPVLVDLRLLEEAGLETADRGLRGLADTVGLANKHRLTVHDAAYLHLALEVEGELATFDRALARAAQAESITVLP